MNSLSNQLFQIEHVTQTIINQPKDPLYIVTDQGNGILQVKPTELAVAIEQTVEQCLFEVLKQFPIHDFHPYVSIFVKTALDCNLPAAIEQHRSLGKQSDLYQVNVYNRVMSDLITRMKTSVNQILGMAGSVEFKKLIYNAHRSAKKNHNGMIRYIDSLFEHYSRLQVIRLDLHYHEGHAIQSHSDISTRYWQAKHDLKHLLNNAKMNSLFDPMVGYIWSLEYGPERGFHYHVFFFFDGSKVRDDVYLAREIGQYWESLTKSCGSYWNCNHHKYAYSQCGIGAIHYSDVEKINYLKQAASYLVKVDHYVRMLTPDNGRTFGRGEIRPPKTDHIGRPRSA
ncbi:inovirus-type Gp2 protein [Methylotuvimicrobium sp. KM1]|uniref:YagK/YfjJ domain-containing protein n=1 Tax=Methylotuvimicrobium sp. KM1 TaxID=3377707 RepID=UPI00384EBD23